MFGRKKKCPPWPHTHEHRLFATQNERLVLFISRLVPKLSRFFPRVTVQQAVRCGNCGWEMDVDSADQILPAVAHHQEFECRANDHSDV